MNAPRRSALILLCGVGLAIVLAGCGGSTAASKPGAKVTIPASKFVDHTGQAEVAVAAIDNDFVDPYITVSPNTKVTWTNKGRNDHSVSPVNSGSFVGISTTDFNPGQSHSATFTAAGDYPYYCSIHGTASLNGQAGVVRVVKK